MKKEIEVEYTLVSGNHGMILADHNYDINYLGEKEVDAFVIGKIETMATDFVLRNERESGKTPRKIKISLYIED